MGSERVADVKVGCGSWLKLGQQRAVRAEVEAFRQVSADGLQLNGSERFEIGLDEYAELRYTSSIKLGRMGVAKALHGQGVGRQMLDLVRGEALKHPARLLIVDAAADVVKFYEKSGFNTALSAKSLKDGDRRPRPVTTDTTKMWLDLAE